MMWDQAIDLIFEFEDERIRKKLSELIDRNNQLIGHYTHGFIYCGLYYTYNGVHPHSKDVARRIDPSLIKEIVEIIRVKDSVDTDRRLITQFFTILTRGCFSTQDIRDVLPECVVILNTYWASIPRKREPAWTLVTPTSIAQYQRLLPKIEMYCAMKYLY